MLHPRTIAEIRDKVSSARVTILVGPTGCGKSTQVPPIVLDALGGPVLCTQPRRLAAVAIAARVARELGEPLGSGAVGYQIGQRRALVSGTRLVFATAGILLERLRADGLAEFSRYSCVLLDEARTRRRTERRHLSEALKTANFAQPYNDGSLVRRWTALGRDR